jgi:hypothetical protein
MKGDWAHPEPLVEYGHREVVLISTDDSPSWGPGHADWKCLACGLQDGDHRKMRATACANSQRACHARPAEQAT